ncbi:MAG TPA: hypothetical protein VGF17_09395 [Phytomonospora sp.]
MERKPIGYWLKHLDNLITTSFDEVFGRRGLGRRHWQVLNSLTRGPASHDELSRRLTPFWEEGAISLDETTGLLLDRGWIAREDDGYRLTDDGRAVQAALRTESDATRDLLTANMTADDYNTVVDGLARMAANLESRPAPTP